MAGWRVGFCAGNSEMIRGLGTIKGYYDYGMFQAIQIAAIVALRETEESVLEQSVVYQGRRDVLVNGLQTTRMVGRTAKSGHVRLGRCARTLAKFDEYNGLRYETTRRRQCRGQSRLGIWDGGRRLRPDEPGRK